MAMINCPECNAQISQKAKYCPKCGYQIRSINQIFLIVYAISITVLALLYFLGILGKNENPLTIQPTAGQERIAYNLSKEYVKKQLNYPRIVRFPKLRESKDNIVDLGGGRYKVEASVEYEINKNETNYVHYVCILINKGQNKWILESIQVFSQNDINNSE